MITSFKIFEKNIYYLFRSEDYYIVDKGTCSKSERTFDMKFFDFFENDELIKVLDLNYDLNLRDLKDDKRIRKFANLITTYDKEKVYKLMTNPTIRILIVDEKLLIEVLKVLKPGDIRVAIDKYNL